jgi:hypothetical protein
MLSMVLMWPMASLTKGGEGGRREEGWESSHMDGSAIFWPDGKVQQSSKAGEGGNNIGRVSFIEAGKPYARWAKIGDGLGQTDSSKERGKVWREEARLTTASSHIGSN